MTGRGDEMGLTLVEMLVVLAIIGVIAGATVLGIGSATRAPGVEAEAQRLAADMQSAADSAMIDDRGVALVWDDRSYGFVHAGPRGWQADDSAARHRLAAGIHMDMGAMRPPLALGVDGAGIPATAALTSAGARWLVVYDGLGVTTRPAPEI